MRAIKTALSGLAAFVIAQILAVLVIFPVLSVLNWVGIDIFANTATQMLFGLAMLFVGMYVLFSTYDYLRERVAWLAREERDSR